MSEVSGRKTSSTQQIGPTNHFTGARRGRRGTEFGRGQRSEVRGRRSGVGGRGSGVGGLQSGIHLCNLWLNRFGRIEPRRFGPQSTQNAQNQTPRASDPDSAEPDLRVLCALLFKWFSTLCIPRFSPRFVVLDHRRWRSARAFSKRIFRCVGASSCEPVMRAIATPKSRIGASEP